MAMAQGIQNLKDDVEPEFHKDDLRLDLCILLDELKQIGGSSIVAEIERFMDAASALPALDQIPKLQGWIRHAEKGKEALQRAPQKSVPQPRKKGARGGLRYPAVCNGEPPKMQAIHCAFAEMAVQELRQNKSVIASQLVQLWNNHYAPEWRSRMSRPKCHGGKIGTGYATNYFSNQLFTMGILRDIASGKLPLPVELTVDDDDDADADEGDDDNGEDNEGTWTPESSRKRRRPNPPPEGNFCNGPRAPVAVVVGSRARGGSGGIGFGEAAGGGGGGGDAITNRKRGAARRGPFDYPTEDEAAKDCAASALGASTGSCLCTPESSS